MEDIHIGKLIEKKLKEAGTSRAELGGRLGLQSSASSTFTNRSDISCQQLLKVSLFLKHDFFSYYYKQLPEEIMQSTFFPAQTKTEQRVKELEKELSDLKKENEYLKIIADLVKKK